jgi:hypothetical protein
METVNLRFRLIISKERFTLLVVRTRFGINRRIASQESAPVLQQDDSFDRDERRVQAAANNESAIEIGRCVRVPVIVNRGPLE